MVHFYSIFSISLSPIQLKLFYLFDYLRLKKTHAQTIWINHIHIHHTPLKLTSYPNQNPDLYPHLFSVCLLLLFREKIQPLPPPPPLPKITKHPKENQLFCILHNSTWICIHLLCSYMYSFSPTPPPPPPPTNHHHPPSRHLSHIFIHKYTSHLLLLERIYFLSLSLSIFHNPSSKRNRKTNRTLSLFLLLFISVI